MILGALCRFSGREPYAVSVLAIQLSRLRNNLRRGEELRLIIDRVFPQTAAFTIVISEENLLTMKSEVSLTIVEVMGH